MPSEREGLAGDAVGARPGDPDGSRASGDSASVSRKPDGRPRCYFHHIPKTAGTTLRNHLIQKLGERQVAPMVRGMAYADAIREYDRYAVITGHIAPVPGDRLPLDRTSVTLVRDPIDRVISMYHFASTVHTLGVRAGTCAAPTFDDWVFGLSDADAEILNAHVALLWSFGHDEQVVPTAAEKLDLAKRALDRFDLVGTQQCMHDSIVMLDFLMGWRGPDFVSRDNPTPNRPEPDDLRSETRARLRELLAPDLDLVAYATARFAKQRSSILVMGTSLNAQAGSPVTDLRREVDSDTFEETSWAGNPSANNRVERQGTGEIVIRSVQVSGDISGPDFLQSGEWATIGVTIDSSVSEENLTVGLALRDHAGSLVFGSNTHLLGYSLAVAPGQYLVSFRFPNDLGAGRYSVTAVAHRGNSHLERCFHWRENASTFEIASSLTEPFEGRMRLHVDVHAQALSADAQLARIDLKEQGTPDVFTLGRRNPALTDFRASITGASDLEEMPSGADCISTLIVMNSGRERWGAYGRQMVQVSYHWLTNEGAMLVFEGLRTPLPYDVSPGQSIRLRCFVRVPDVEGGARLLWTLVQEEVAWFDAQDAKACLSQAVRITR